MRAAVTQAPTPKGPVALPLPPVRLRVLLFVALAYAAFALGQPRLVAAWQLHAQAAALADYGACMAGPTGPALLRDRRLESFQELLRRRLVATPAGEAPFERCAPLARKLTDSPELEALHRERAYGFAEYGGNPRPRLGLRDLPVSSARLAELARSAWPFASGYASLVKTSLGAREAAHPAPASAPRAGRGLPQESPLYRGVRIERDRIVLALGAGAHRRALESSDGGVTFRSVPASSVRDIAERCPAGSGGRSFVLSGSSSGGTTVLSLESASETHRAELGVGSDELVAVACDERVLVVAARPERGTRASLWQCAFGGACTPLNAPKFAGLELGLDFPLDVARAGGATIVALTMGHVVRVASSRDSGVSWTPFAVAYDGGEHPLLASRRPTRLLAIGRRVLLYGGAARADETYGLLYSDDQGASFRGR